MISGLKLAEHGVMVEFDENGYTVRDRPDANGQQRVVAKVHWVRGLCYLGGTPDIFWDSIYGKH